MSDITINHKKGRLAENVAKIETPASATAEDVAEKLNEIIDILINSKQMRAE